jgi:hypothetical protein
MSEGKWEGDLLGLRLGDGELLGKLAGLVDGDALGI